MRPRVVAVILATGTPPAAQLRALASQVCAASCERVAIVLGAKHTSIAPVMTGVPVAILTNVLLADGPASSIRRAVAWALRSGCDGLLLVTGDEPVTRDPLLTTHVEKLLAAFAASHEIAASRTPTLPGLPAIFPRAHFARLAALTPQILVGTSPLVITPPEPGSGYTFSTLALQMREWLARPGTVSTFYPRAVSSSPT